MQGDGNQACVCTPLALIVLPGASSGILQTSVPPYDGVGMRVAMQRCAGRSGGDAQAPRSVPGTQRVLSKH